MISDDFDQLMKTRDPAMVIVTTATENERAGCLVGFHSQCSISPQRYAVWLSKANHTCRVALYATHLAIHFLSDNQRSLAELFGTRSGDDVDKFKLCDSEPGPHGVPLLADCASRLIVRRTSLLEEGSDHFCIVTEPVSVGVADRFSPLRFSDVADLVAGHAAVERTPPATTRGE